MAGGNWTLNSSLWDLKNVGDIVLNPVQTQFGYHTAKLAFKMKKPFDEMKEQNGKRNVLDAKLKDSAYLHQMQW